MTRRIAALIAIFLCTSAGWMILGTTIFSRTYETGSELQSRVSSIWGSPHKQQPPAAFITRVTPRQTTAEENGKTVVRFVDERVEVPVRLERSRIKVDLDLDQRRKGLLWFATYKVAFQGQYLFRNDSALDQVTLRLPFPASDAIYDDLVFRVDGKPVPLTNEDGAVATTVQRPPGSLIALEVGYRSQGLGSWLYSLGDHVTEVRDFVLEMTTDFEKVDFPAGTIAPTAKRQTPKGWKLVWHYRDLVTGYSIGMTMPEKLQPGPLAGRISYFAPVSLLFFFFLMFMITSIRKVDLHPMNYFFLAAAFFAFHLLLAYLVDHISIHLAFVICSVVSIFLVVSYLRLVAGLRFALFDAALSQFVYLVLFSYAFFFDGFTGLAITIGAIITLFIMMQVTGRIDWSARELRVNSEMQNAE